MVTLSYMLAFNLKRYNLHFKIQKKIRIVLIVVLDPAFIAIEQYRSNLF